MKAIRRGFILHAVADAQQRAGTGRELWVDDGVKPPWIRWCISAARAFSPAMPPASNDTLAAELIALAGDDLRVRDELARDGSLFHGYHPTMRAVHDHNAARLTEIIDRYGWPCRSLVGEQAAHAAWTILQHAIGQPHLQRRGLALLRGTPAGEVDPIAVGTLEDRIRAFEGRGQLYGTQFDWDQDGALSPLPIEDPANVDGRRAQIGLGPLAEEVERRRAAAVASGEPPPADWVRRRREFERWLRAVGWRSSAAR